MKKKTLALFLALALVLGGVIGGTMAWLTDKTPEIVNTFTDSDIEITLTETGAENNANSYKMVPGYTISKDPKVTVVKGSEKCYLFVKLEKSEKFDSFLTYEIATGWTQLTDAEGKNVDGVYYRTVEASDADQEFEVLANNQVTVKGEGVTKEMMNALTEQTYPKLTVTAYASQFNKTATESFDVNTAWTNISSGT